LQEKKTMRHLFLLENAQLRFQAPECVPRTEKVLEQVSPTLFYGGGLHIVPTIAFTTFFFYNE
jgi:hypothetical protein